MIPVPVNAPNIIAKAPVERSCNCCDYVVCTITSYCCGKRSLVNSPKNKVLEIKVNDVSQQTMDEKEGLKEKK